MTHNYVLVLLTYQKHVLMINRINPPFQGLWNGVGGKLEAHESFEDCVYREVAEETGFLPADYTLTTYGHLIWYQDQAYQGEIGVFTGELKQSPAGKYPQLTREGILSFCPPEWLLADSNQGLVPDLKALMPAIDAGDKHDFLTVYEGPTLTEFKRLTPAERATFGAYYPAK